MYTVTDRISNERLEIHHYLPALLEAERRYSKYLRSNIDITIITEGNEFIVCKEEDQ